MNENELNEFIINYVKREKTQSALMLSGQWGIGKSYYINNSLKENLKKNDFKMISVSLYGLTSIHDISKSIYIELKLLKKKHSKKAIGMGEVAKLLKFKTSNGRPIGRNILYNSLH